MLALRNVLLFNLLAVSSFATAVNPFVGYIQWSSDNNTRQGFFEVMVHTNTNDGSAQVADYVKLVNVNLAIDIQVGQSLLTQSVTLHRAFSQSMAAMAPATNVLFPSLTCTPADCPGGIGNYFTQAIGPNAGNGFVAPTIVEARLTYTAIADTTPVNNPYWQYIDQNTQAALFTPEFIARTITLLPGPSPSFGYDGVQSPIAYLNVSGETVPEPSTALLCSAGLALAFAYRRSRESARR